MCLVLITKRSLCCEKHAFTAANENIPAMAVRFSTIHRRDFSPSLVTTHF